MAVLSTFHCFFAVSLLCFSRCEGSATGGGKRGGSDKCSSKGLLFNSDENGRKPCVTFRNDNCSLNWNPYGKHAIHEVNNVTFSHLSCDNQAAVLVHWMASPLGIEHVKGFRVYLEDKNPEGKQCQHMILKDPRLLNFSFKNVRMSSQPFIGLAFETDYMVRIVPFPTFMNDSFFPPSFLRTNSCEALLGSDNLICKPFWRPKFLSVSQMGSSLHVVFDHAPSTFGFSIYYLYYKLRQEGPFRLKRCKPEISSPKTTCVLQDVTPGTYAIELRDDNNATMRQTQYHVSPVQYTWAGPIRAMAITVPLVIMSAFATLFTVMCRKKQQENIYSHLDEESSESTSHTTALISERPWPRPKVFICYSSKDCHKHLAVIQTFAFFLQDFCGCEVHLDLWEHLEICKEGQMSWLSRQLDEAHFIITVCSKGLKYFVEKRYQRSKGSYRDRDKEPSKEHISSLEVSRRDTFVVMVTMIAEKLHKARQASMDVSRFMAVYFDYSHESDVPTCLSAAPRFKLMDQLPQLFACLHSRQLSLPDREPQPPNVSKRNYFRSKSGRSLYVAICNMHQCIAQEPDWFERQLAPPPPNFNSASTYVEPSDYGLVLNEVVLKKASENELPVKPSAILQSPSPRLGACSVPGPDEGPSSSPPEMPRDSGIYDSSVPSSELSIPLMEGLSPDQADSSSLADSISSSSGLGDEEPPAVNSLHCAMSTVCKAELHHGLESSPGLSAQS
ncbi:interleukin-17 receptor D isoform X1 [Denticeps clupeoides]|uniref:Interleukin-17 receptor D n=2 Tax=Denticeps clupeoides TaxID=299321 RepID=A0AAY4BW03_9TELE|nr:interleukin-17 receptor D isoform X1 [Denticeps clupeoides]XP_028823093.1 interleukin-17 receptor D isoform X1 [Denticeps clupeoides]